MNFKFLRVPVHIQPMFFVFLLFFTNLYRDFCLENIILGSVFFFSLLVHEYGHALTALYFGANPWIVLEGFGGQAHYNSFRITSKQRFIITLNGPLLESILVVIPYALLNLRIFSAFPLVEYTLFVTMKVNILWCLLNLIPVAPLDGGHLLQYILEKRWGERGGKIGQWIGLASVCVIAPYLFFQGYFFFGSLLLIFGWNHFQELKKDWRIPKQASAFRYHVKAEQAIKEDQLQEAKILLKKLLKTKNCSMQHSAIENLAKIYEQEGKSQKAYELLLKSDHSLLKDGKCLLCRLAYEQKNYDLVAKYAYDIYEIEPSYEIATLNGKAFAKLEQMDLSEAWFSTAAQFETAPLV